MNLDNSTVIITGAGRGLGRCFVDALLERGASRIYAGTRTERVFHDERVTPVRLDVTDAGDIEQAVRHCNDVTLLINNAGIMLSSPIMAPGAADALRKEVEVNVFGLHAMTKAFAPVLKRNGGGGIINMLSVVSWFTSPFNATYGASKHAALSVSDASRIELSSQGIQVTGVYAGFIDTDMTAHISHPKSSPQDVVKRALDGFIAGSAHVMGDTRAEQVWHDLHHSADAFHSALQESWDQTGVAECR